MPKNCLFIIDSLGAGGAERVVLTLARTMSKYGHKVSIISIDNLIEYDIDFPVTLRTLDFKKSTWQATYNIYGKLLKQLVAKLESESGSFDLITSHLQKAHRLTLQAGINSAFYCIHSTISQASLGSRKGLRLYFKRRKLKSLLDGRDIITVSKGIASDLIDKVHVKPRSIRTIYNPLDFEHITALAEKLNPFADEDYIIHVGRVTESKRHDILLKAYARTQLKQKLLILGDGPLLTDIKRLASQLDISNRVIFAGFHENPYPIIKGAKLTVLSSDYEGLPTALIESLILNVPVVSTDCPSGPSEIMTGDLSCHLTPVGDVPALAVMLENAIMEINRGQFVIDKSQLQIYKADYACNQYLALAR